MKNFVFLLIFLTSNFIVLGQTAELIKDPISKTYFATDTIVTLDCSAEYLMEKTISWVKSSINTSDYQIQDNQIIASRIFSPSKTYGYTNLKIGYRCKITITKNHIIFKYDNFYYKCVSDGIIEFNTKYFEWNNKKFRDNLIVETNNHLTQIRKNINLNKESDLYEDNITSTQSIINSEKRILYEDKIASYTTMKNTGSTLSVVGLMGGAVGAYMYFSGLKEIEKCELDELVSKTNKTVAGAYIMIGGGAMLITGIVLNNVGHNKINEYNRKLNNLNFGLIPVHEGCSFYLSYKF